MRSLAFRRSVRVEIWGWAGESPPASRTRELALGENDIADLTPPFGLGVPLIPPWMLSWLSFCSIP